MLLIATACSDLTRGAPCGGGRSAEATAVLPDTGLGAGGTASITYHESDPQSTLYESSLIVWTFPAAGAAFADSAARVRVVTDDGRVLLDRQSIPAYAGSWYAIDSIPNEALRDAIVSAFQTGAVVVEFSRTQPVPGVTRVRPTVRFAGRTPVVMCL